MDYIIASYRGESGFDAATQVVDLLMWLALVGIATILIIYFRTPLERKKAHLLVHYPSVYLVPIVYTVIFLSLRWYISLPLNCALFLIIFFVEKSELKAIEKRYSAPSSYVLKESNKCLTVLFTLLLVGLAMGYLALCGAVYQF